MEEADEDGVGLGVGDARAEVEVSTLGGRGPWGRVRAGGSPSREGIGDEVVRDEGGLKGESGAQ